jgi:UDP-N-acetylglucosamine 2-epimerase (non-hydrolysing)
MKQIGLITGARPNFMKTAPIIDALNVAEARASGKKARFLRNGTARRQSGSSSIWNE